MLGLSKLSLSPELHDNYEMLSSPADVLSAPTIVGGRKSVFWRDARHRPARNAGVGTTVGSHK